MPGWLRSAGSGPLTWMLSNATSTAWNSQHQRKGRQGEHDAAQNANVTKEKNEDQTDQRVRRRPGKGPALLYRSAGLREKGRLQPGAVSLAHGGLTRGPGRHGVAAGAQQQPGDQNLPAGQVPARPARGHVLHRRRAGRLRAYESARRRVHHATKGCDGIQDRHVERHLRQSHSGHAADALVDGRKEKIDEPSRAIRTGSGQRGAGTKRGREVDPHSRQRTAPLAGKSLAGAYRPGAIARVGALRHRWEPGYGWNGEAHLGGKANAAGNKSDASRRSQHAGVRRYPVGTRSLWWRYAPDAMAQDRSPLHRVGRRGLAHLLRRP